MSALHTFSSGRISSAKVYLRLCRTSMMEHFMETDNG